ncbi:DUF3883 domain-containing protein [Arcanobacterium phocisimile]|uniref:DUF3883 domain-containing protein n=2 Tax=Arcanobacterium phocisimile TaxID=1302235 RepID=A0ABX7IKW0_9ACTO|nr:DUF3883 domain-containing protein [Arcanobacterium phocisimile]
MLAALQVNQRIHGLVPGENVTLIRVDRIDDDLVEVTYRYDDGRTGERSLTAADVQNFSHVRGAEDAPDFNADPDEFRLAAEALRIKYAATYDPMAAVSSSDVEPLPHQIRAVYEELIPRIPLRFLLADDPGAGKTIMAGLYLKELILRSDCDRAIIVAPGALVEQWREELAQKFDLRFEVFSRQMIDDSVGHNVFAEHPFLIARMDQLSRNEDIMEQLRDVEWDVAIVDEAHRMSAHYSSWEGEVKETKRFALGRLLSETAHNYLLMTATPHAGKEEDFQLFMSLLDRDRFEGKYREGVHRTDTSGIMRRMVKEDLLTFEGKPLFPERKAYTVEYELSADERDLYEQVTDYVRTEMGRADQIAQGGDKKRSNNVGFALTVLQRRLASSPAAILRSLERRQQRLSAKLTEMRNFTYSAGEELENTGTEQEDSRNFDFVDASLQDFSVEDFETFDEETTEEERAAFEEQIEQVVDLATAARTIPELRAEIATLENLILLARRVRYKDDDKKWVRLRAILDEKLLERKISGETRKIIIFTEHRDTLDYLHSKIAAQFGREDSVITIHGGTRREERKLAQERFTHNRHAVVLLATDAAGEGLNLQRAHLMVNYDLPWNPNRIEQRFGRIHRIGQREVCHLWNMVARDTREGDVFARLLDKIKQMSIAYNGSLFNVLGEGDAFQEKSLRDLLIEAIRYGDQPQVKAKLHHIIDEGVSQGLDELRAERALHQEMFADFDLESVRAQMEKARERRLQPGYIAAFFLPAFQRLGGRISQRESGRYEIMFIPQRLSRIARRLDRWAPIPEHYERVTFDRSRMRVDGLLDASMIAPGHPLLHSVIEATIEDLGESLKQGTVLIDRSAEQGDLPMLMYSLEQRIANNFVPADVVSRHFNYALLSQDGHVAMLEAPPYLDYDRPEDAENSMIAEIITSKWVSENHEKEIRARAYYEGLKPRMEELKARLEVETQRVSRQVEERLLAEINHWDSKRNELEAREREGNIGRIRADAALAKVHNLEKRLAERKIQLAKATELVALPTVTRSTVLVLPSKLVCTGKAESQLFANNTAEVERRAVEAVLAVERALGREPMEMPRNNPGYDIRSVDAQGYVYYIEVKGRIEGSDTFTITTNEITFAQTQEGRHRLALVEVSTSCPDSDRVRYVCDAFSHLVPSVTTRSYNELWCDYWERGNDPR